MKINFVEKGLQFSRKTPYLLKASSKKQPLQKKQSFFELRKIFFSRKNPT